MVSILISNIMLWNDIEAYSENLGSTEASKTEISMRREESFYGTV